MRATAAVAGVIAGGLIVAGAAAAVVGIAAPSSVLDAVPVSIVQPVAVQQTSARSTQAAVQAMLDRVLGAGHSVVRVVADVSLGDGTVTTTQWGSSTPGLNQSSGVVAGAGGVPVAVSGSRTNAVGGTTTTVRTPAGALVKETVAVAVDTAALGRVTLGQLRPLIDTAAGVSVSRGDVVTVVAVPFSTATAKAAAVAAAAAASKKAADDRTGIIIEAATVGGGLLTLVGVTLLIGRLSRRRARRPVIRHPAVQAEMWLSAELS